MSGTNIGPDGIGRPFDYDPNHQHQWVKESAPGYRHESEADDFRWRCEVCDETHGMKWLPPLPPCPICGNWLNIDRSEKDHNVPQTAPGHEDCPECGAPCRLSPTGPLGTESRMAKYREQLTTGEITPDDIRRAENYAPQPTTRPPASDWPRTEQRINWPKSWTADEIAWAKREIIGEYLRDTGRCDCVCARHP